MPATQTAQEALGRSHTHASAVPVVAALIVVAVPYSPVVSEECLLTSPFRVLGEGARLSDRASVASKSCLPLQSLKFIFLQQLGAASTK